MNRRAFIKGMAAGGILLGINQTLMSEIIRRGLQKITILHTNDIHSRIEPYPANHHRHPSMGGLARLSAMIKKIRQEEKNVFLFDAGDIYQGTPYFNIFHGELEFKLLSEMGYNGATVGNHEFDNGLEGLFRNLPYAKFPFISSNYDFSDTILNNRISKYQIYEAEKIRIGVFGLGIAFEGLVTKSSRGNTIYLDPVETAAKYAHFLRKKMYCDLVICLSHLGYRYDNQQISDISLAKQSKNIDIIIGGHTHTTLRNATVISNSDGKEILICQAGHNGLYLGRVDIYLKKNIGLKYAEGYTINILKKQA